MKCSSTVRRIDLSTLVICFDFQDDVAGKCKVRYEVKSRHLSRRPKVVYKTRNLTECTDRAQSDIGIHVHSYEEKVRIARSNIIMGEGGWWGRGRGSANVSRGIQRVILSFI